MSLIKKLLLVLLLTITSAHAERVSLVDDLAADQELAKAESKAILLMFSATDCPYCIVMEEDFLDPILINPETSSVLIRKIEIDINENLIDFDGKQINARDLVDRYRIRVTPTLLFLEPGGYEIAGRIVGVMTRDYLGLYIDNKIELAKRRIAFDRRPPRSKSLSPAKKYIPKIHGVVTANTREDIIQKEVSAAAK